MDKLGNYSDDSADNSASENEQQIPDSQAKKPQMALNTAPDVDISALQVAKKQEELTRFERETVHDRSQNHLTGFIQDAQINVSRFNDERVRFDNTGVSMNPTDGAGITSSLYVGQVREDAQSMAQKSKR